MQYDIPLIIVSGLEMSLISGDDEEGKLYKDDRKMSYQEKNGELREYCPATDFVSPSPATPTTRHSPDHKKLPYFHYKAILKTPRVVANLMIISLELK